MQCGYCTPAMILTAHALLAGNPRRRARTSSRRSPATSAAAPAMRRSSRRSRSPPSACAAPTGRWTRHERAATFRFVSSDRRVREDRRFVAGKGRFVADIDLPGMRHVALVTARIPPRASCRSTKRGAGDAGRALRPRRRGARRRHAALTAGLERRGAAPAARASTSRATPANGWRRWSRIAARSPRMRPRWSWSSTSRCPSCSTARRLRAGTPVHEAHGSNVLLDKTFVWGEVDKDFAESRITCSSA